MNSPREHPETIYHEHRRIAAWAVRRMVEAAETNGGVPHHQRLRLMMKIALLTLMTERPLWCTAGFRTAANDD